MARRRRWNHSPAFKAKVAVAVAAASHRGAIGPRAEASGEKTPIELAQDFDVHPNQFKWRDQLREGAAGILAIA